MSTTEIKTRALRGGEFLVRDTKASEIFTPDDWSEEMKMIEKTCHDFVASEVTPNLDRIDALEDGLMASLLDKAGELGLLGISISEELGGLGMDFKASMLLAEATGHAHSFSVAYGAHTGIGTLPIYYYGTEEQKQKYIPKLATGEWKACYCLTEPGSGSDANSGKTKAVLTEDGKHYLITGQKMWITNGGFADVFTVFAKIEGDKNLSAFIIDKGAEGLTLGAEEKKMGIKGSSTRQVFFNNVKIPVENMLGEREQGFKIALNILNIGRIKLAAGVLGGAKQTCAHSVKYANEREQFGRSISKYGAIKAKLAEQAVKIYALETATYRISQNIDDAITNLKEEGMEHGKATLKGIEQFAAECAMMKVFGSEVLDYVVDEGVQIYGGMGYSMEMPVERAYRDARINRIFEGTNEINRMLTVDILLKRAMKGELDLMGPAMKVVNELMDIPELNEPSGELFAKEKSYLANFKKSVLLIAGAAAQKLTTSLAKEQEILMNIADMAIQTYVAESLILRAEKLTETKGEAEAAHATDIMRIFVHGAAEKIGFSAREALQSFAEGDEYRMMSMGIKRFSKTDAFNSKDARRRIADTMIAENTYCF